MSEVDVRLSKITTRVMNMTIEDLVNEWNDYVDKRFFKFGEIKPMTDVAFLKRVAEWLDNGEQEEIILDVDMTKKYVFFDEESNEFSCFSTVEEFKEVFGTAWLIEEIWNRR